MAFQSSRGASHAGREPAAQPFGVYARPFVPEELRSINVQPATVLDTLPGRTIALETYASSFIPPLFLRRRPTIAALLQRSRDHASLVSKQPTSLTPETYAASFGAALVEETQALDADISNHALYRVPLDVQRRDDGISYCVLHVPGIRENSPHIELEEVVSLRQLVTGSWNGLRHIGFTGFQYNARVHLINRANELLTLRLDHGHFLVPVTEGFNVSFNFPRHRIEAQNLSLALIQHSLGCTAQTVPNGNPNGHYATDAGREALTFNAEISEERDALWARRMLFPDQTDGALQTELTRLAARNLFDRQLNFEQQKAVDSVCRQNYGEVPFLISGPPGTGKTKTIVECVLQLVSNDSHVSHILLCAPSDPAADTLAQRISKHMQFGDFLRLNAPTRTFAEVPEDLMPHCYIENDQFSLPAMPRMMAYKVVVTTCRDAAIIVSARLTNIDLFALEHSLATALHQNRAGTKFALHWDALIIDEAAQAMEPEAAVPISVVVPPEAPDAITFRPVLVMAGDQMQLGPRVKNTQLKTSLFERLFNRSLYKDHPLARGKNTPGAPSKPLDKTMLPITRPPFSNLIRNYRSHPAILAVPSSLFYHDTLVPEASQTGALRSWPDWQGRRWPVLFKANTGPDEMEGEGGGWYNVAEARLACNIAQSLARSGLVDERDICIMSPFHAQVRVLRSMIREPPYEMWKVNIGPLEAFQGLESRVVIVCTTRTRARYLEQDCERGLGVVHEQKRFNVALTRAKEGLVVIGNPHVLGVDPCWAAFLAFCQRHGLWAGEGANEGATGGVSRGPGLDTSVGWQAADSGRQVSTLETGLVTKEAINQDITSDYARFMAAGADDEMWVSGMLSALTMDVEGEADPFGDELTYGDTRGLDDGDLYDESSN
ncbi:DNA helicase UvrD/REP type [Macrophomina phaseolina MS6]|uniref:DNA helicase UvrD/REP type n=1 Tax=Macrophomina phaseolina (strain MS6) TaxID=1126212 RepID=K2SDX4_MACPH|nr:DNA helicase UvrD/REP type [Macrophomina phaseolina MS6]